MKILRRFSRRVRVSDDGRATPPAPVESAPARAMQRLRIENRANKAGRRRSRLSVIGLVLSVGFVISAGRAVQVAAMGALADDEVGAVMAEATPVRRASLLDRDGEILAATLDFHSVYADPLYVWDAEEVAQQLATVLPDLDVERLTRRLSSNSRYVPIADGLSPRMRQAIHLLGLPGINFEVEPGRIYPKQRVAAHLVGYVDGQMQGVAGAERAFEAELAEGGRPVSLSIDLTAQYRVESVLRERMAAHQAAGASAVLMRVGTGEIIAMASLPDYDPNRFAEATAPGSDIDPLFNQPVQGVYELGSVFKPLSLAAGLQAGSVHLDDVFDASTPVRIGGHTIHDYRGENRPLTAREMLLYSSNIAASRMADVIGADDLTGFYSDLRLFEAPPVELMEAAGPNLPRRWGRIQTMTASYGHGFQVSQLALASAYAALANGGVYTPPTLRPVAPGETVAGVPVMSPSVSAQVLGVMREFVARSQTGTADVEGLAVAGKTGTAERVINGAYVEGNTFNTFVAIFPFDDPQYVLTVSMDRPRPTAETHGFSTAGWTSMPAAGEIIRSLGGVLDIDRHDADPEAQVSVVAELFAPRPRLVAPSEEPVALDDAVSEDLQ